MRSDVTSRGWLKRKRVLVRTEIQPSAVTEFAGNGLAWNTEEPRITAKIVMRPDAEEYSTYDKAKSKKSLECPSVGILSYQPFFSTSSSSESIKRR